MSFTHPAATRSIVLDGVPVAFAVRRGRRRTIGFSVGAEGLVVSAPRWVTLGAIDDAVREKSRWIVAKLDETHARERAVQASRIEWRDGAVFDYLGAPVMLRIDPSATGAMLNEVQESEPNGPRHALHVGAAIDASSEQIASAVRHWLQRQARRHFSERLDAFAPKLGVRWTRLTLSNAGTRWGTAKSDGSIRLHWRLMQFKPAVIDYVVVHELAHLRVMDHSPRFWAVVEGVLPDHLQLREELKARPLAPW